MGDVLPAISPAGGAVGLFFGALFALLGFFLRRLDKGNVEINAGYSGLVVSLRESAAQDRARAERYERTLGRERAGRIRAEEYAYSLETALGVPHRRWDDEDDPT